MAAQLQSHDTYKNKLQEICQSRKDPVPKYTYIKSDEGTDHQPIWNALCTVEFAGHTYKCKLSGSNKTEASEKAAKAIYKEIKKTLSVPKKTNSNHAQINENTSKEREQSHEKNISDSKKTSENLSKKTKPAKQYQSTRFVVFVDLDNVNLLSTPNIYPNVCFKIFVGKGSTKKYDNYKELNNCNIYVAETAVTDAADHYLSVHAGIELTLCKVKKIDLVSFILTRDHYGEATAKAIDGSHYCQLSELTKKLDEYFS